MLTTPCHCLLSLVIPAEKSIINLGENPLYMTSHWSPIAFEIPSLLKDHLMILHLGKDFFELELSF
jgi:hypothetical protein